MNDRVEKRMQNFFAALAKHKKRQIDSPICPCCLVPRHEILLNTTQVDRVEAYRKHISSKRCTPALKLRCYCVLPNTNSTVPPEAHHIHCPVAIWFPWSVNFSAPLPSPVRASLREDKKFLDTPDTAILVPSDRRQTQAPLPLKLPEVPQLSPTAPHDPNAGIPKTIIVKDEKQGCEVIMAASANIHSLVQWSKDCEQKFSSYYDALQQRHTADLQKLQAKHANEVSVVERLRKESIASAEQRWTRMLSLQQDAQAQMTRLRAAAPAAAPPVVVAIAAAAPAASVASAPEAVATEGKDEKKPEKPKPKPRGRPTAVHWAKDLCQITTIKARKRKQDHIDPFDINTPGAKKYQLRIESGLSQLVEISVERKLPVGGILMFRTGKTDAIHRPDMELCAVCHKYGRWTLAWRLQKSLPKTLDMGPSMLGVAWVQMPNADEETGLKQVNGCGHNGWDVDLAAFVGYMMKEFHFDSKFFIIARNEFGKFASEGYDNTLV